MQTASKLASICVMEEGGFNAGDFKCNCFYRVFVPVTGQKTKGTVLFVSYHLRT